MELVETFFKKVSTKKWDLNVFKSAFKTWIFLLLSIINFKDKPDECLKAVYCNNFSVVKKFQDDVTNLVSVLSLVLGIIIHCNFYSNILGKRFCNP